MVQLVGANVNDGNNVQSEQLIVCYLPDESNKTSAISRIPGNANDNIIIVHILGNFLARTHPKSFVVFLHLCLMNSF